MYVSEAMSTEVFRVGPTHTLRDAASLMAEHGLGAAVVMDPEYMGAGIITERDILRALAAHLNPDREMVGDHLTTEVVYAAPGWTLEEAAAAMVRGRFRHLIVLEEADVLGVLSMRDIVTHLVRTPSLEFT